MSIEVLLNEFKEAAASPAKLLKEYKAAGKKVVGVLPYYAPEELVYAAGIVPMGIWGSNTKTINRAKEYCATFYCTIAQLALEMLLDGTMDQLDGIITPTICDTLRPMSQNFRVSMGDKMKVIFLAHPQNRFADFGLKFCADQYGRVRKQLEEIAGAPITDEAIREAIKVYNRSRAARLERLRALVQRRAAGGHVVHRAAHGQTADVAAGEEVGRHHEAVRGERQPLARRRRGQNRGIVAAQQLVARVSSEEHIVDDALHHRPAAAVPQHDRGIHNAPCLQ